MELSRKLAKMGHKVHHVYFADNTLTPHGETGTLPDDSRNLRIEGLRIRSDFARHKHSVLKRRQTDLEYGNEVAKQVDAFRPDVVVSANMPLDAQAILQRASRQHGARFVFWLQDVYSVAARFFLRKKAKPLAWIGGIYFERLEKKLLRQSDAIVCIAPGFAEYIRKWGIPESKIHVIRNWAPLNEVLPAPRNNAWAMENGVDSKACFMYSGTLGTKHRPELLLELGRHFEKQRNARLIVIAAGPGADWLRERAREVNPEFLTLLPFQPYERISEVMASADVLITLLDSDAGAFAVPSKTLSYLCAGRAQIVAAPSANEAASVLVEAQAGLVVSPDDPMGIIAAAERFLSDPGLRSRCATNARAYAERHFSIDAIAARFMAAFEGRAETREIDSGDIALASSGGERNLSWKRQA